MKKTEQQKLIDIEFSRITLLDVDSITEAESKNMLKWIKFLWKEYQKEYEV